MTIAALSKRIDSRFGRAEKHTTARFDAVDARFGAVEARFDARFNAVDGRFARMERQIDSLTEKLDQIAGTLDTTLHHQQKTLDEHEDRLQDLERGAGR